MPPNRQPKQHCSAISDDIKRQICEQSDTNKNKKHHEIAEHFNNNHPNLTINRSTVSNILKEKDKWKAVVIAEVSNKTFR